MNHEDLNENIRIICKELLIDGYKKSKICSSLLGQHNQPMFENFISKDKNFGIGVLTRMLDAMEYDVITIPVDRTDKEKYEPMIQFAKQKFEKVFKEKLKSSLDNSTKTQVRTKASLNNVINDIVEKLFEGEE